MNFKLMVLCSCVNGEIHEKKNVISNIFSTPQSKLDNLWGSER